MYRYYFRSVMFFFDFIEYNVEVISLDICFFLINEVFNVKIVKKIIL